VVSHRQQRPLAQRNRQNIGCTGVPDADGIFERHVAVVGVTVKDLRDPLQERGDRRHDACLRELACRFVGVGAHLLDAVPAQQGPQHRGPGRRHWIVSLGLGLVLPAVHHVGPPVGLDRPPGARGQDGSPHRGHRVPDDPILVF
jgi:hypothetical protein